MRTTSALSQHFHSLFYLQRYGSFFLYRAIFLRTTSALKRLRAKTTRSGIWYTLPDYANRDSRGSLLGELSGGTFEIPMLLDEIDDESRVGILVEHDVRTMLVQHDSLDHIGALV